MAEAVAVSNVGGEILAKVISVLENMTQDWDLEIGQSIGPETRLIDDLTFESIDVVQFAVALEQAFECKDLPFERLFMVDGDYVTEIRVHQVAEFLNEHLPTSETASGASA